MARVKKNTEVRRAEIIAAVQGLIDRYGSEHVTVRNIAKEVQISEAAIYRHFKSKREIFSYLAKYISDALMADLCSELSVDDSWTAQMTRLIDRHLEAIQERRGISFLVLAEIVSLGDRELYQETISYLSQYIDRFEQLLATGVEKGDLRKDLDAQAAARMLFSSIMGMVNLWALHGFAFDLKSSYAALWNELQKGMSAKNLSDR